MAPQWKRSTGVFSTVSTRCTWISKLDGRIDTAFFDRRSAEWGPSLLRDVEAGAQTAEYRQPSHMLALARERADLAERVRWVATEDGDGAVYDITSFEPAGRERLIEVKTTNGSARTPFFLSRNERDFAEEMPAKWRIYRVHLFAKDPRVFTIAPPLETAVNLQPETWRASF